jgi:MYXO-CTERM domain-containing protein
MRLSSWTGGCLVSLALVAVGCGGEPFAPLDTLGTSEQGIVNGELDNGDPAVVALMVQGFQFCTGTLISPRVILSAAHCTNEDFTGIPFGEIEIFFGPNVMGPGELIATTGEGGPHPAWSPNDQNGDNDVGLLRLVQDGPATPIPPATKAFDNSFIGEDVRLVGFGITSFMGSGDGVKRQATSTITNFVARQFIMEWEVMNGDPGTCNGDSGGPAFLMENGQEVVAGIHTLSNCENASVDERVDAHVENFIQPFIGQPVAQCTADGSCAQGCPDVDPDCPCATDGFCATACLDAAMDTDCTSQCAPGGLCVPQGCGLPDPDCTPPCGSDGQCDPMCQVDPDCAPACGTDGQCDPNCGTTDPDCNTGQPIDDDDDDPKADEEGGCSVVAPGDSAGGPGYLAALGLILIAWRRRRAIDPKS